MKNVAIIDSGSGGVNVLKILMKQCRGFNFLYFADNKCAPYGDKDTDFLNKRAVEIVSLLEKIFKPEIIIFACNTLTSVAIKNVRKMFPNIIFIGCEPAIKPACEEFNQEEVLLLATKVTIDNCQLIKKFPKVKKIVVPNLPKLIDENLFEVKNLSEYLQNQLDGINYSAIVLGCTHFEALRPVLADISKAKLFGSNMGIAKMLARYESKDEGNNCSFMVSGNEGELPKLFHYLLLE